MSQSFEVSSHSTAIALQDYLQEELNLQVELRGPGFTYDVVNCGKPLPSFESVCKAFVTGWMMQAAFRR